MRGKIIPFKKDETEHELCGGCKRRMTEKRYLANLNSGKKVILCKYCYDYAKNGSGALKQKATKARQDFKDWYQKNESVLPGEVKVAVREHVEKYHD